MTSDSNLLAERLRSEIDKTLAFFDGLAPEDWQVSIYTEGTCWTPERILAHFVTAEKGFVRLLQNVIAGGTGVDEGFDIDEFNERQVAKIRDVPRGELFQMFKETRDKTVALVSSMAAEDLEKTGRHPFLGNAPIETMVKLIYRHNQIHQREIRKVLADR